MGQFWTNHPTLEDTEDWTANVDGKQTATHHRAHLSGRKYSTLWIGRRNRRNLGAVSVQKSNQQLRAAHRACLFFFPFFPQLVV
jgi:hypothetical protein